MKNSRLFELLFLLLEHQELTADVLAAKLEVSRRTIYRDLDALSAAGIPVYAKKGQGGGIRLMEQFRLDRSWFSEDEQEQILTALQSLNTVGVADKNRLLSQLSGLFGKKTVEWLEVDFDSWGAESKEKEFFDTCKQAILRYRLLSFDYFNSSGNKMDRTVEPLKLCFKGGSWYLSGYCRIRQDFRLFRLSRIYDLKMKDETFIPREQPAKKKEEPMGEKVSMKIEFAKEAAYQVMDFFAPEQIEVLPDKTLLVNTAFPQGRWITCFLLSFGSQARVLEPEWLKQHLKEEAEKIGNLY